MNKIEEGGQEHRDARVVVDCDGNIGYEISLIK